MNADFFPLLTKGTYLNTAYVGPLSTALAEFRNAQEQHYVENGVDYKISADAVLEKTHHALAHFFGLETKRTFVVPNFSIRFEASAFFFAKKTKGAHN